MADLSVAILRRVSSDLSSFTDGREIPEDSFIVSLEFVYRELVVLETTSQLTQPALDIGCFNFESHSRTADFFRDRLFSSSTVCSNRSSWKAKF